MSHSTILLGTLLATLYWGYFYWIYRKYRIDLLRQRLFHLRDELFLLAAEGELEFETAAYRMTRSSLNGFIRFAHRLTVPVAISFATVGRRYERDTAIRPFDAELRDALEELPEPVRSRVSSIHHQMHWAVTEQLLLTSGVFWVLILPWVLWLIVRVLAEVVLERLRQTGPWHRFRATWVYPLDRVAWKVGGS